MLDGKAAAAEVIKTVREFVARHVEPIKQGLADLEKRLSEIPAGPKGDRGDKGESIKGDPGTSFTAGNGPPLSDGKSGDVYLDVDSGVLYRCD